MITFCCLTSGITSPFLFRLQCWGAPAVLRSWLICAPMFWPETMITSCPKTTRMKQLQNFSRFFVLSKVLKLITDTRWDCLQSSSTKSSSNKDPRADKAATKSREHRRLIISTGDTSDVDGFLALAEYSKVGVSHRNNGVPIQLVYEKHSYKQRRKTILWDWCIQESGST